MGEDTVTGLSNHPVERTTNQPTDRVGGVDILATGSRSLTFIVDATSEMNSPMDSNSQIKVVVASDVHDRDGIGVEIYLNDELAMEIFRDDTKKSREVSLYKKDIPLSVVEESIAIFKREIPWAFIEDNESAQR